MVFTVHCVIGGSAETAESDQRVGFAHSVGHTLPDILTMYSTHKGSLRTIPIIVANLDTVFLIPDARARARARPQLPDSTRKSFAGEGSIRTFARGKP